MVIGGIERVGWCSRCTHYDKDRGGQGTGVGGGGGVGGTCGCI